MLRVCALTVCAIFLAGPATAGCVVLLHGLARTSTSMQVMARALEADGHTVINRGYASRTATIKDLADEAIPPAVAACGTETTDFVTHSMGGILLRVWAEDVGADQIGRVVMLGPPNQGSELVDALQELALFDTLNGPAGQELGTGEDATPLTLGAVDFDLGVIAGDRSLNPIYSGIIPGPDDGKVSVEATKVEGMDAHLSLPVTHTFMMVNREVIAATRSYLATGAFPVEDRED
ncbi:MAG: alpha/beta hydrolase [Pseudomonadota bacterium]